MPRRFLHDEPIATVQGRILIDPTRPPRTGRIVIEGDRIDDVQAGEHSAAASPPDLGAPNRIICPAFIDAHFHIPQINAVGCDGMELLDWLDRVIYPAEQQWGAGLDIADARTAARRLALNGTVGGAAYLTSLPGPSAEALAHLAHHTRLRFVAGRVAMDRSAPDDLTREDRERPSDPPALAPPDPPGRVTISVNPRFAISCTEPLLQRCADAARSDPSLLVQTHLAETIDECRRVADLFPHDPHYAGVYDRFGLLGPRTLLAHCIHLSDDEWRLIAERGAVAVHCPTANLFLASGLFDLDAARRHAVRLALGSDIAAGPDPAMPRVARAMIETAKARRISGIAPDAHVPSPAEAWHLITRANAQALGWSDAGVIEPGAAADLLVLRIPDAWNDEHLIGRLIYNWSPDLIEARVFAGRAVDPDELAAAP